MNEILDHLRVLVGCDTRNPPRAIGHEGLFDYLRAQLHGFEFTQTDHGAGAISLLAARGKPRLLFNVHLDTVPDSPQWSANPFELRVREDRAIGLGACDIKGAAAALLAVANASKGDLALLFTTDEEANDARCVAGFLREYSLLPSGEGGPKGRMRVRLKRDAPIEPSPQPLSRGERGLHAVIVAEPTRCEAVLVHRGIASARVRFAACAGHASGGSALDDNALHQAVRWASRAIEHVEAQAHQRFGGLTGLRFNIGRLEGGIKANMIAPQADVLFGFRPLPSMDIDELLRAFRECAPSQPAELVETFRGSPLPAGDLDTAEAKRLVARDLADELGLPIGNAVDFWTEAALFSQAGYVTFVYGPGDIAQAHGADEWVALEQLRVYARSILRIVDEGLA
ncbi:MAG: M20/M25/M40 family metallo-hydrolase [Rhodanobacteraceae bacterium]